MPRVNGIMQLQPNAYGVPGQPVKSAPYNSQLDDFTAEMNAARPITAGGTGANSAEEALSALGGVGQKAFTDGLATRIAKAGDRMTGALSSAVKDHLALGPVTEEYKFADGNTHKVEIAAGSGTHTINPTGLNEGDVMQVNIRYTSGALAVSGTTQWELGGTAKGTSISDVGAVLTAGVAYCIIFEIRAGIRTAVFQ